MKVVPIYCINLNLSKLKLLTISGQRQLYISVHYSISYMKYLPIL